MADESVEREVVDRLRADGHGVTYIAELAPALDDDSVLDLARRLAVPLVTTDKGFGELVFRQRRVSKGVILVRLAGLDPQTKAAAVASVVSLHADELQGAFSVISPGSVRIRFHV